MTFNPKVDLPHIKADLPLIALVGRPNVGKSSLFNRLTRSRAALVDDTPGLTRDRQYGVATVDTSAPTHSRRGRRRSKNGTHRRKGEPHAGHFENGVEHSEDGAQEKPKAGSHTFRLVDTGGFEADISGSVASAMREQTLVAIQEADAIVFVVDAQSGPLVDDWVMADLLRRSGKPLVCVANKAEGQTGQDMALLFHQLGLHPLLRISATHGMGMDLLVSQIFAQLTAVKTETEAAQATVTEHNAVRVAVVGCPNAGKSTLINRMVGEARLVVSNQPGTTRDSIDLPVTDKAGRHFVLVDTAGIRKKSRISLRIEKYSVLAALRAMDRAQVAVLLLDAVRGITDQDQRVANLAMEAGCGLLLAVNKWDAMSGDSASRNRFLEDVRLAFPQSTHAPVLFLSAKTGWGVNKLFPEVFRVWEAGNQRIPTGALNRWLVEATTQHAPPRIGGRVVKIRYITQVSINPPTLVLFTNRDVTIHETYRRYLESRLRSRFGFSGASLRVLFRAARGDNPYV